MALFPNLPDAARLAINHMVAITEKEKKLLKKALDLVYESVRNDIPLQTTGTFTPTLQDNSESDAEGQTYSWQRGFYIKTGKQVTVNIGLNVTSIGTMTGSDRATIAGLPFPNASDSNNHVSISVGNASATLAAEPLTGVIFAGSDRVELYEWSGAGNTNNCTIAEFGGSGEIMLTVTYWTD